VSVAVPSNVCSPLVVTVTGGAHVAIPDTLSEQLKVTVALLALTTPMLLGVGEIVAVMVGGAWSIFSVIVPATDWPPPSVAVPVIIWFAPSVLTVCEPGHETGGTPPVHANVTVTGELFQLAAFGAGVALAVTVSAAGCTLNVTLVEAVFPARSVADPLNVWFAPTVVTLMVAGQLAVPERASVHRNATVAGAVTTPLTGAGVMFVVIPGLVLSIFSVTETDALLLLASVAVADTT
jgi:hypothetical protein